MKKYIVLLLITLSLSGCSLIKPPVRNTEIITNKNLVAIPPGQFYFFSVNCPHCTTVKQYVKEHGVKNRLYYVEREVTNNQDNVALLQSIGQRCNIPADNLSIPFFWDGQNCYQGADEVIAYFEKIEVK